VHTDSDADFVRELARAATTRIDLNDKRIRRLEELEAERRGATAGFARLPPWVSIVIALGALALNVMR
jgi:hypothetical protein